MQYMRCRYDAYVEEVLGLGGLTRKLKMDVQRQLELPIDGN
jgi:hypothetical protein